MAAHECKEATHISGTEAEPEQSTSSPWHLILLRVSLWNGYHFYPILHIRNLRIKKRRK